MALSDRDIIITPNRGAASEPNIAFRGADAASSATINLRVYNSGTVGTISFEGNSGQLLSITDSMSGSIFSVNDVSGIPSIEVFDTGEVRLAQYNGYVDILNPTQATSTNSGALQVVGGVGIGGNLYVGGTIYGLASVTGVISTATNIAGGAANRIVYQTAPGATNFITAPSVTNTVLTWNGSAFTWAAPTGASASTVATATRSTNATHYLTFVDSDNGTAAQESLYTDAGISYNPSTNDLTITGLFVQSPATLGTTLGNTSYYQRLTGSNGNTNYLETFMIRDSAGTSWTTAGTRIQQKIDSTWMAYQQFNGTNANGGIEWGSGTTTTSPQAISARMRLDSAGVLRILTNTNATTPTTGSLVVTGGIGLSGNLYSNGLISAATDVRAAYMGLTGTSGTTGYGISLYGGPTAGQPTYGLMFQQTGTFGTHGNVTADWATYFTMNNTANRGWIFRDITNGNRASISNLGDMSLTRSLGVGTAGSGVAGEIRATNEITAYYTSDARLKENIVLIADPITKIMKIRGVNFDWIDKHIEERGGEDGYFVRKHDVGVIAQEIEKVLPEAVATRENGYKAVRYEKIVPLLIECIKSQQTRIDQILERLEKLANK